VPSSKPLAIDLFCGLGGWTEGLLAEGYRVIGFDIEQHSYGDARYPAQLVIQDVLTIHGSQLRDAALIVASPPCQAYSYRAMPWKRAKALPPPDNSLFEACFRIKREASEAAGRDIPLVVENVRGAQKYVGRARWHYGSFYLWGDVPALMPIPRHRQKFNPDGSNHPQGSWFAIADSKERGSKAVDEGVKVATMGMGWYPPDHPRHRPGLAFNGHAERNLRAANDAVKVETDRICDCGHPESEHGFNPDQPCNLCSCINPVWVSTRRTDIGKGARFTSRDCGVENSINNAADGCKQRGSGPAWFRGEIGSMSGRSSARKAASARIAKIPLPLARHIAKAWFPEDVVNGR